VAPSSRPSQNALLMRFRVEVLLIELEMLRCGVKNGVGHFRVGHVCRTSKFRGCGLTVGDNRNQRTTRSCLRHQSLKTFASDPPAADDHLSRFSALGYEGRVGFAAPPPQFSQLSRHLSFETTSDVRSRTMISNLNSLLTSGPELSSR
jgi:hypothetical protein